MFEGEIFFNSAAINDESITTDKKITEKILNDIFEAYQNRASAIKKKEDTHKMAESNKAFAHFRW